MLTMILFHLVISHSVTLAWDPSPSTEVTGYFIYWGPSSVSATSTPSTYPNQFDAGAVNAMGFQNVNPGETNYFAATAYNAQGSESELSNEVSYTLPVTDLTLEIAKGPNQSVNITSQVFQGGTFDLQSVPDLLSGAWVVNQSFTAASDSVVTNLPANQDAAFFRIHQTAGSVMTAYHLPPPGPAPAFVAKKAVEKPAVVAKALPRPSTAVVGAPIVFPPVPPIIKLPFKMRFQRFFHYKQGMHPGPMKKGAELLKEHESLKGK